MKTIKTVLAVLLTLIGLYMLIQGFSIFIHTSGQVQGSEFGMLITLANQFSLFMVWCAVFGLWKIVPATAAAGEA